MKISKSLKDDISKRFNIGEEFLSLYKGFPAGVDLENASCFEDVITNNSSAKLYLGFAFSSIIRGRQARDVLLRHTHLRTGRYLDVGTAYGGFLVAFHEVGFQAVGIEIDPYWASLGNANCRDHGMNNVVINCDFLKVDIQSLGKFDVITCNDVIEHVLDPRETIKRIAQLLNPGGIAIFEIPNRRSVDFVSKDGHYQLFGLSLLEHFTASHFLKEATGADSYSCGEMYGPEWYINTLSSHGLQSEIIKETSGSKYNEAPSSFAMLSHSFSDWYKEACAKHSPLMIETVLREYGLYCSRMYQEYASSLINGKRENFERRFLSKFWTILARREQ